jgi:hypothetical protein
MVHKSNVENSLFNCSYNLVLQMLWCKFTDVMSFDNDRFV